MKSFQSIEHLLDWYLLIRNYRNLAYARQQSVIANLIRVDCSHTMSIENVFDSVMRFLAIHRIMTRAFRRMEIDLMAKDPGLKDRWGASERDFYRKSREKKVEAVRYLEREQLAREMING